MITAIRSGGNDNVRNNYLLRNGFLTCTIGDIGACFIVTHTILFAKILAYQGIFQLKVVFLLQMYKGQKNYLDLESLIFNFFWFWRFFFCKEVFSSRCQCSRPRVSNDYGSPLLTAEDFWFFCNLYLQFIAQKSSAVRSESLI